MIEMEVVGVAPEPNSNRPLVWLKDKDQKVFLPIAIGNFEATAIYMELYNEPPPRPITYDLLRSILDGLNVQIKHIVINALQEDTFYAEVCLSFGEQILEIDSRPSDGIALALRVGAPIYVEENVIREAGLAVEKETGKVETRGADGPGEDLERAEKAELQVPGVPHSLNHPVDWVQRVVTLKAKLQEAVSREEYEEAAKLRDEIGRLEHEQR